MAITPANSIINLGLPNASPDNFTDPQVKAAVELFLTALNNLLVEIERYTGITQRDVSLWNSLLPTDTLLRQNLGRLYVIAFENLIFGDLINIFNDAGTLKARKANAANGLVKPARGFCSTTAGILTGSKGEVILSQGLATITGVARGDTLFLSTSAGQASITASTGAGQLEQFIGIGVDTNVAYIDISMGAYLQH
jgi:hypothetical protein